MSRIESLTDAQQARFAEFADRWTQIGLCTEPADRPRAEAAIRDMYRQGGLEPPKEIVWCGSPLSQGLTRAIIVDDEPLNEIRKSAGAPVGANVWNSLRDIGNGVGDSVWDSVKASAGASVGALVGASVKVSVSRSVGDSVRASIRASVSESVKESVSHNVWSGVGEIVKESVKDGVRISVGASVGDSIECSVWASTEDSVYGAHDAGFFAFSRYFHDVVGLTAQTGKLSGLWELAQSAGWALPHQHICWVSERHHILSRDDRGRLHCEVGPAVAYPDGWSIYAIHGVCVPRYVIEKPNEISLARINRVRNAERRRVMIERYRHGEEVSGAAAFIRDAGAKQIDHDEGHGTLWRCDLENDESIVIVEVINATREPDGSSKRYWLRVHPELRPLLADNQFGPAQALTVRNAIASTFGLLGEQYAPAIET